MNFQFSSPAWPFRVRPGVKILASLLLIACMGTTIFAARAEPSAPQREPRVLLIPPLAPAQKLTEAMQARLKWLKEEDGLSKLDTWNRLTELPTWVFEKAQKHEIAYLGSIPALAMDAFRYAVIVANDGDMIVIRAGGFAGSYDIFQMKKASN